MLRVFGRTENLGMPTNITRDMGTAASRGKNQMEIRLRRPWHAATSPCEYSHMMQRILPVAPRGDSLKCVSQKNHLFFLLPRDVCVGACMLVFRTVFDEARADALRRYHGSVDVSRNDCILYGVGEPGEGT